MEDLETRLEILAYRLGNLDQDAWKEACELIRDRLRTFAQRLCQNQEDADDLVAQTLERAWRFQSRYDSQRPLLSWTYRIMVNQWNNWRGGQKPTCPLSEFEDVAAERNDPISIHFQVEMALKKMARDGTMASVNIVAFKMRYMEDPPRTLNEIGKALNLGTSTVHRYTKEVADFLSKELEDAQ